MGDKTCQVCGKAAETLTKCKGCGRDYCPDCQSESTHQDFCKECVAIDGVVTHDKE